MDAINAQISFGRRIKKTENGEVVKKPNLLIRAKDSYVQSLNDKYDVDYENLSPEGKKIIRHDAIKEGAFNLGATALTVAFLLSKGRNVVNGFSSAVATTGRKILGKAPKIDVNGKELQDLGGWVSAKFVSLVQAPQKKIIVAQANEITDSAIQAARKQSSLRYQSSAKAINLIEGTNGFKYQIKTGETIDADDLKRIFKSLQEMGESDLAAKFEKQLKENPLSGEAGIKYLDSMTEALRKIGGKENAFNTSVDELNRIADNIAGNGDGNQALADAIRRLIPADTQGNGMISVDMKQFNKMVADNRLTVFPKANKPVQFDTNSQTHKLLKKVLKDDSVVEQIETKLGNNGYGGDASIVDGVIAGVGIAKGGTKAYEAMDAFTDENDESVGNSAIGESDIEELAAIKSKVDKNHKINDSDAKRVAKLVMSAAVSAANPAV